MSWAEGPWAGIDLETTALAVEEARIVTGSVFIQDDGCKTWLLKPDISIPPESTAIHGISNEQVQQDGMEPAEGIYQIHRALQNAWAVGAPVVAHNAVYDMSTLDREMRRHLGYPLEVRGPVIDTLTVDKAVDPYRKGSRKLADACLHWGVPVQEADLHTSNGDVMAAVRLAWQIARRGEYNGQPLIDMSLKDLHHWQMRWYAQQRASFNSWLRGQGRVPDDENTMWPVKPYGEAS